MCKRNTHVLKAFAGSEWLHAHHSPYIPTSGRNRDAGRVGTSDAAGDRSASHCVEDGDFPTGKIRPLWLRGVGPGQRHCSRDGSFHGEAASTNCWLTDTARER